MERDPGEVHGSGDNGTTLSRIVHAASQSIAGLAAITLGLLYFIGVGIKVRELHHAGLSVRDVLPLFSLEQLLRTSLTIVMPSVIFLLVVLTMGFLSRKVDMWANELLAAFGEDELLKRPNDAALEAEIDKVRQRRSGAELDRLLDLALHEARQRGDLDVVHQLERVMRSSYIHAFVAGAALVILPLLAYPFLPWKVAVSCFGLYLAFLIYAYRRPLPGEQEFGVMAMIFVLGAVASAAIYPRSLPEVELEPTNDKGRLIVISESTWYLAVDGRPGIQGIPTDDIDSARVTPYPAEKSLWETIL